MCHKLRDACTGGEFGECSQLRDFGTNTWVGLIDWIHLLPSLPQGAQVGALPDSGLHLPLEKFPFACLLHERALRPDVSLLLTNGE